ncbi:MAG: flagellar basal body-associated FliL family protein [Magnetospirillum sp. WYHS-4]
MVKDLEEDDGEDAGPAKGKGGKKKLIVIVAAALVVLLAGGGAAFFFLGGKKAPGEQAGEEKIDPNAALKPPLMHEMADIVVDLKTDQCRTPFLKLKVRLAVTDEKDVTILKEIEPFLIDKLKVHLRDLTANDLRGAAGSEKLRFDIANMIVVSGGKPVKLRAVLFKEFLLQ